MTGYKIQGRCGLLKSDPDSKEPLLSSYIKIHDNVYKKEYLNHLFFEEERMTINDIDVKISRMVTFNENHTDINETDYVWDMDMNSSPVPLPIATDTGFFSRLGSVEFTYKTNSTFGIITPQFNFVIIHSDMSSYIAKKNIKYAMTTDNAYLLVNNNNSITIINEDETQIDFDDIHVKVVTKTNNEFVVMTSDNSLFIYNTMLNNGGKMSEVDGIVDEIACTYDTITVVTVDGRVWLYGNPSEGGSINGESGFIKNMFNAVDVVRSHRAGAILTSDMRVWVWGDTEYGGGPSPGYVCDLDNVINIYSTFNMIYAVKNDGTIWAWSGKWLKKYIRGDTKIVAKQLPGVNINFVLKKYQNKFGVAFIMDGGYVYTFGNDLPFGLINGLSKVINTTTNIGSFAFLTTLGHIFVVGSKEWGGYNENNTWGYLAISNVSNVYGKYGMYAATLVAGIPDKPEQQMIYTWGRYDPTQKQFSTLIWGTLLAFIDFIPSGRVKIVATDGDIYDNVSIRETYMKNICGRIVPKMLFSNINMFMMLFECYSE